MDELHPIEYLILIRNNNFKTVKYRVNIMISLYINSNKIILEFQKPNVITTNLIDTKDIVFLR